MSRTASDVLIETIHAWGIDTIFGLPGDGINGIMEALRKRQKTVRFIQVRHEESAAFMACAYAKHTGRLGCCLATSGPGGIHLLNGLYDAKLDGQPVLAITGMQFHDLAHTHSQQDVELDKLFTDVCVYNARCMGAEHIENIAELACRTAAPIRPDPSGCSARNRRRRRWRNATRFSSPAALSHTSNSCPSRDRPAAYRSIRIRYASAFGIRWKPVWPVTAGAPWK